MNWKEAAEETKDTNYAWWHIREAVERFSDTEAAEIAALVAQTARQKNFPVLAKSPNGVDFLLDRSAFQTLSAYLAAPGTPLGKEIAMDEMLTRYERLDQKGPKDPAYRHNLQALICSFAKEVDLQNLSFPNGGSQKDELHPYGGPVRHLLFQWNNLGTFHWQAEPYARRLQKIGIGPEALDAAPKTPFLRPMQEAASAAQTDFLTQERHPKAADLSALAGARRASSFCSGDDGLLHRSDKIALDLSDSYRDHSGGGWGGGGGSFD